MTGLDHVPPGETVFVTARIHAPHQRMRVRRLLVANICEGWTIQALTIDGVRCPFVPPYTATHANGGVGAYGTDVHGIGVEFQIEATNTTDRNADLFASLLGDLVDDDVTDAEVLS